jgi:hypothetical protein
MTMRNAARSYLNTGISLSAASAIALAPFAISVRSEPAVAIPNVTVSDIQWTVTPEEIVSSFDELQRQLDLASTGLAVVLSIPGLTLLRGLEAAIELNDDLYGDLRQSTDDPTLLALLDALQRSVDVGLTSLADAVAIIGGISVVTLRDITDLVTGTVIGSLSNVLSAAVAVANDSMNFATYAGLLGAGVATGELIVDNGLEIIQRSGDAAFVIADAGIRTVQDQINNAIRTVRDLIDVGAGIFGSELISAVVSAVQEIVIGPAQAALNIPFDVAGDVVEGFQAGFNTVVDDVQDLITSIATNLQTGLGAIGANPAEGTVNLSAGVAETRGALINGGANSVVDVLDVTSGAIGDGPQGVIAASNAIGEVILNPLEPTVDPSPPQGDSTSEITPLEASGESSAGAATLAEDSDGQTADDLATGDEATGDQGHVPGGADSDEAATAEKVDTYTADRSERDAQKAEPESDKREADSDSGSGADAGSDSE